MKNIATQQRMKYITFIAWVILPGLIGFTACSKDEEVTPASSKMGDMTVSEITTNSASFSGFIVQLSTEGVTDHGFVWGTEETPTIDNNSGKLSLGARTETGTFTANTTALSQGVTYYARLYATDAANETIYSGEITFSSESGWVQKGEYPHATTPIDVAGFEIGEKIYVGGGTDYDSFTLRNDFWEYNTTTDTWTQLADMETTFIQGARGFSIDDKGYIFDGGTLWEYNPNTNTWTEKVDFPGAYRQSPTSFVINGKVYLGMGVKDDGSAVFDDFWEYDPITNTWTEKTSIPTTEGRAWAVGFSINNKGYAGLGGNSTGSLNDFWEYDATTDTWTQKSSVSINGRDTGEFVIESKGYVYQDSGSFIIYDPVTDTWETRNGTGESFNVFSRVFTGSNGIKGYVFAFTQDPDVNKLWEYTPE